MTMVQRHAAAAGVRDKGLALAGLAAMVAAAWAPPAAQAAEPPLPDAMTVVTVVCSSAMGSDNGSFGPLPAGLTTQCDESGSSPQGQFGQASWQAVASATTGLGSQTGGVGLADVVASATATNINGRASASATSLVNFSWRLTLTAGTPFTPASVPVRFTASGEGHLTGKGVEHGGRIQAEAGLQWPGFPLAQFSFDSGERYQVEQLDRQFGGSAVLGIAPGYTVAGWVLSSCQVSAFGNVASGGAVEPMTSSSDCNVSADPLLALDQAAFDAAHGAAAFRLADHYRLDYSNNLPVPEPSAAWLWLAGLGTLAVVGPLRRRPPANARPSP